MLFLRKNGPTSADFIAWATSLTAELCILVASYYRFHGPHSVLRNVTPFRQDQRDEPDGWDYIELGIALTRVVLIVFLAGSYVFLSLRHKLRNRCKFDEEVADESTPLLRDATRTGSQARSHNGATPHASPEPGCQHQDDEAAFYRPEKLPHKTWWEYVRGYSL